MEPQGGGLVESYVHTGSKVAVLISLISEGSESINNESINHMTKDLCMLIAATSPVCVSRENVPEDLVAKEKEIAMAQEGKPPQAIEKIVQGKLEKYFQPLVFRSTFYLKILIKRFVELLIWVCKNQTT